MTVSEDQLADVGGVPEGEKSIRVIRTCSMCGKEITVIPPGDDGVEYYSRVRRTTDGVETTEWCSTSCLSEYLFDRAVDSVLGDERW